jgi:protein TonB
LLSALAHLAAAISVGAILRSTLRAPEPAETVEVDLAYAPSTSEPAREGSAAASESPVMTRRPPRPTRPPRSQTAGAADLAGRQATVAQSTPDREAMPARFALSAGTVATVAGTVTSTASSSTASRMVGSAASGPGDGAAVVAGDVSVPARLLASRPLVYPPSARLAEIEVDLPLEIIVEPSGGVSDARALIRAGYGLDEAAVQAIRQYRFAPALRDGRPVRVKMRWTVQFRLQ